MEKEIKPIERMTPSEVGKILHTNAETIRAGLKTGRFPFGYAVPPKDGKGNWSYIIIKSKFLECIGEREVITNEDN